MSASIKSRVKLPSFSPALRIHKAVRKFKVHRSKPPEDYPLESATDSGSKDDHHEWTIAVFRNNLKEDLLRPMRRLKKTDSQLTTMNTGDLHDFQDMDASEANRAFLWAAFLGKLDLMEFFTGKGADIGYQDESQSFNALHLAALANSIDCCRWLCNRGCPVIETTEGMTPVHYAALGNSIQVMEFFIYTGFQVPQTAVNLAVYANATDCVKFLLSLRADVNAYHDGLTPLHIATDLRYVDCIVQLLNDPRTDIDSKTDLLSAHKQYTALHLAAENGYVDCIELLLGKGASMGELNRKQQTPLHLACKMDNLDCIQALLEHRAPINEQDLDDKTPLHMARSLNAVELLVRWGADVNVSDKYGYTPLHIAALNESEEIATFLILKGANIIAETKSGLTTFDIISRKTPNSIPAIWNRFTMSLSYNSEQSLKFNFRELLHNSTVGEIGYLYTLQTEGYSDILRHPLSRAFIYLKWQKIKLIYFIRTLLVLLLISLITFIILIDVSVNSFKCDHPNETHSGNDDEIHDMGFKFPESLKELGCEKHTIKFLKIIWIILIAMIIIKSFSILLFKSFYLSIKNYIANFSNVFEIILITSMTLIAYNLQEQTANTSAKYYHRKSLNTITMLSAWIYLTLVIGQLPYFGTYITMFKAVFKALLKLLSIYIWLLLGFSLTFWMVLNPYRMFDDPWKGFAKTLAMMTGELNMDEMMENLKEKGANSLHTYTITFLLMLFILLVMMVLMNLLIGIAVNDIEGLQKNADLMELVHQTKLIHYFEVVLFRCCFFNKFQNFFKEWFFVSPNSYRVAIYVKPLSQRKSTLPQDLMMDALQLALAKGKPESENNDLIYRMEQLEKKISEIYDRVVKNKIE